MNVLTKSIHQVYDCRENFILIGLTGRTGSGCSTAAEILSSDIKELNLPRPTNEGDNINENRKYKIIYEYALKNWKPFIWIKIKDIITSFILENTLEDFVDFIADSLSTNDDQKEKIKRLFKEKCEVDYGSLREKRLELMNKIADFEERHTKTYNFYFVDLPPFSNKIKDTLVELTADNYTRIYQIIGDNIRSSGSAIASDYNPDYVFSISKRVNRLIKHFREKAKQDGSEVFIVIDTLRNPFEALFFRERYSAFYLMAINTPDKDRRERLQKDFDYNDSQIDRLDEKEYSGKKKREDIFISQNIQKCYDLSDIHINNPQIGADDLTQIKAQLAKFICLILHPGLIMPTSVERCMQIAHTAKLNSGCMSRQVGAALTNQQFSIKAIGWNTSAEGQAPCLLRSVKELLNSEDKGSYSHYERNDSKFRDKLRSFYLPIYDELTIEGLKGRNIPFCFKDIKNNLDGEKNQVHTRALHAEENAFLQLSKYGNEGILGGFLFTTSSPCELCAKKAVQLGIKKIFYIDPYPGISEQHILSSQNSSHLLELFSGAIGRAYHQLYEPIMPYKDELELMINFRVEDPYQKLQNEIDRLNRELENKENIIIGLGESLKAQQRH
jgi:dCMP deaminase